LPAYYNFLFRLSPFWSFSSLDALCGKSLFYKIKF
jgi:hypothetical protein